MIRTMIHVRVPLQTLSLCAAANVVPLTSISHSAERVTGPQLDGCQPLESSPRGAPGCRTGRQEGPHTTTVRCSAHGVAPLQSPDGVLQQQHKQASANALHHQAQRDVCFEAGGPPYSAVAHPTGPHRRRPQAAPACPCTTGHPLPPVDTGHGAGHVPQRLLLASLRQEHPRSSRTRVSLAGCLLRL